MRKVAILTLPFEPNYGWILQLWALYSHLQASGYEVTVLDRRWNDNTPSLLKQVQRFFYYNFFARSFTSFFTKMHSSPIIRSSSQLHDYIAREGFYAIIVGSDQIWRIENTRGADLNFFLDITTDISVKKIAYAASFGNDIWKGSKDETRIINNLLKGFDLVSVRESSGVDMCRVLFSIEARQVLDPTMLLEGKEYDNLINNSFYTHHRNLFMATYLLDTTPEKQQILSYVKEGTSVNEVVSLYPPKFSRFNKYKSVEVWLRTIRDAQYVVIDSFHGMVFSILFHKQFLVIGNVKRGLTRFSSLLGSLGLESRLITEDIDKNQVISLLSTPIDYESVESKLLVLREESIKLLSFSLADY